MKWCCLEQSGTAQNGNKGTIRQIVQVWQWASLLMELWGGDSRQLSWALPNLLPVLHTCVSNDKDYLPSAVGCYSNCSHVTHALNVYKVTQTKQNINQDWVINWVGGCLSPGLSFGKSFNKRTEDGNFRFNFNLYSYYEIKFWAILRKKVDF